MNRIVVTLDVATAAEAHRVARAVGAAGAAVRVGPRLLHRAGPAVVAVLRPSAAVMVDARISGSAAEVAAGVRALAAFGAGWITVDGSIGPAAVLAAAEGLGAYEAHLVATTVAPEADDPPGGRGKAVSSIARDLAATGIEAVLGTEADIGVVVQVAPDVPVVVSEAESEASVRSALERGARAVVVGAGIARASDPAAGVAPFIEAAA